MLKTLENIQYDVAVIGGGPAGMMAAGTAAMHGARVILIEKNKMLGRKLLITGKGRCNITNADTSPGSFLERFGKKGDYFFSILHGFSVEDTISFFTERGMPVKTERGGRVFPESDRAGDVLAVLQKFLREHGVTVQTNCRIQKIECEGNRISAVQTQDGIITARNFILCTGGLSYPATGSTGDGLAFARVLGHSIIEPRPSLVPIILEEKWAGELEGLSLKNVAISIFHENKKISEEFGEALFTANGMSGPIILDLSKKIGEILPGQITLSIDFKPALDNKILNERIQRDFRGNPNRMFRNSLDRLLPSSLVPVIVRLSGIDPDKKVNSVTREERKKLVNLLKDLRAHVAGLEGFDKAIITAGGISLDGIDLRTMRSKVTDNLFFAGEIIDIDGPSGGYNLQICWSTGYCAGKAASEHVS